MARARWRALLTAAGLVPSRSAVSLAFQRSTSHSTSAARCRDGSRWTAVISARRMASRIAAASAGSAAASVAARASSRGPSGGIPGGRCSSPGGAGPGSTGCARRRPERCSSRQMLGGDPVEPGAHARAPLEPAGRPPGPQHGLLDGVLGLRRGAEHPVAVAGQLTAMVLEILHRDPHPRGHGRSVPRGGPAGPGAGRGGRRPEGAGWPRGTGPRIGRPGLRGRRCR